MSLPAPRQPPWPSGRSSYPAGAAGSSPGRPRRWGGCRGERPPPSVKAGKARWWGSSPHLAPPLSIPPLPAQQQQRPPQSALLWASHAPASLLECPAPGVWVRQRLRDDPGPQGPWRDGAPGSASFSIFKNRPPLAIQRRTLSPVSGCRSHVQHVCQLSQESPTSSQTRAGEASAWMWPDLRGRPLPTQLGFPGGWGSVSGTQSCSESAFARAGTAGPWPALMPRGAAWGVDAAAGGLRPARTAPPQAVSCCLLGEGRHLRADPGETQPNFSPILAKRAGVAAILCFPLAEKWGAFPGLGSRCPSQGQRAG